jgi:hypothetical protein
METIYLEIASLNDLPLPVIMILTKFKSINAKHAEFIGMIEK